MLWRQIPQAGELGVGYDGLAVPIDVEWHL
jgi:hypothetical protein